MGKDKQLQNGGFHSLLDKLGVKISQHKYLNEHPITHYEAYVWLKYIFSHEEGKEKNLIDISTIENFRPEKNARNRTLVIFMSKGHKSADKIELSKNFAPFLKNINKYLFKSEKEFNYEGFYILKDNVKKRYIEVFGSDELYETNEVFTYAYSSIDDYTQAELPKVICENIKTAYHNDTFSQLTWLLLLSLYPNNDEGNKLAKGLMKEISLLADQKSFSRQCKKISSEKKIDEGEIRYHYDMLINSFNDYIHTASNKIDVHQFLSLFYCEKNEEYNKHISDFDFLKNIGIEIDEIRDKTRNYEDDDSVFYEIIRLLLLKSSFFWKMSKYDDMNILLNEIEDSLYNRPDFTDKYVELYAQLQRKQGIYYNHTLLFEDALKSYRSSYFKFTPDDKYERSKIKNNEGYIYRKWCKFDKACIAYDNAYELRKHLENRDPYSLTIVESNKVISLALCHQFNEAEKLINHVCEVRNKIYNNDNTRNIKLQYTYSINNFALLKLLQGMLCNDGQEEIKKKYLDESISKSQKIVEILGNNKVCTISDVSYISSYNIQQGICHMQYKGREKGAKRFFDNAIKELEQYQHQMDEGSDLIRAYALLYRSKLCLLDDKTDLFPLMSDIITGYSIIKEEYNKVVNPSYLRYAHMIGDFHLGAYVLLLHDEDFSKFCDNLYKYKSLFNENDYEKLQNICVSKSNAKELIESAYNDILELEKDSKANRNPYRGYNKKAFEQEKKYIEEFKKIYCVGDGIDIPLPSQKERDMLKKYFYDFFMCYLW